jgi:hypothetical protein
MNLTVILLLFWQQLLLGDQCFFVAPAASQSHGLADEIGPSDLASSQTFPNRFLARLRAPAEVV